jgi:signal transduction histidine kinase
MSNTPARTLRDRFSRAVSWAVPVPSGVRDAAWWRARLLGAVLVVCAVAGAPVLVVNAGLAAAAGAWIVVWVDLLVYAAVLGLLAARRMPTAWRATGIVLIGWGLGMFLAVGWGPLAAGPEWLMVTPIIAAALIGLRASLRVLTLVAASVAVVWWMVVNGRVPWVEGSIRPLPTPDAPGIWLVVGSNVLLLAGLAAGSIAVLFDGLDREVRARRDAEAERERLTRAVEQGGDAIVLFETDGRVRFANPSATVLLAAAPGASLVGREAASLGLVAEPTAESSATNGPEPAPWDVALAGGIWRGRCRPVVGDGDARFDGTCSPVRDEVGAVSGALLVLRDVTREVLLEERLRQAARLEAVGTLMGGVAHDFNNLLQPILANAEALRDALPAGDAGRALADDIVHGAERGRGLVRRVLTFTRGAAVDRQPTRVADVVEETLRLLRGGIPETVRLTVSVDPALWVSADPAELHHALVNLATNGSHAMPGGGDLQLEATALRAGQVPELAGTFAPGLEVVCITVRDTGTGMDAATLARWCWWTTRTSYGAPRSGCCCAPAGPSCRSAIRARPSRTSRRAGTRSPASSPTSRCRTSPAPRSPRACARRTPTCR